jgi:hypothetical protein
LYGSIKIPAVAFAMPLNVDSEANETAVTGSQRWLSIENGLL